MSATPKCNQGNPTRCTFMNSQVRMVTGDNLQTAKAIALECGILASSEDAVEPNIIEGKKFRELSEKEREQVAKKITVCFLLSSIVISLFYALVASIRQRNFIHPFMIILYKGMLSMVITPAKLHPI